MTKIGLVFILILLAGRNYAQQNFFILIQADNKQAFYVLQGGRSFNSTSDGSLILSQLKDSVYNIVVGFPGKQSPEQPFSVELRHKDQQFLLRTQADKGWVLYNPLTGETRTPDLNEEKRAEIRPQGIKKDDAFSRLMADVVHDTAVMYNTYAADSTSSIGDSQASSSSPVSKDQASLIPASGGPDSSRISVTGQTMVDSGVTGVPGRQQVDSSSAVPAIDPVKPDSGSAELHSISPAVAGSSPVPDYSVIKADSTAKRPVRRTKIVKLSERKLPHSVRLAFSDRSVGKKADTVILFIMVDTPALSKSRVNGLTARVLSPDAAVPVSGNTAGGGEGGKPKPDTSQKRPPARAPLPFVNSDCHDFATDYDLDKLRVKMLEATKDEYRIQAARKVFKLKCFSTRQIRALSEVFTTDASRFRFYETAYPFAADDHFRELAGTLTDPVYNSKFKAMTGQQ
jgi:hypothetical protein